MSSLLYRLGKFAYRARGRVLLGWLVVLVGVMAALAANPPQTSAEFTIPGTPSQEVLDQLATAMPASSGGSASITFVAPAGERLDTPERAAAIAAVVADLADVPNVVTADAAQQQEVPEDLAAALTPAGNLTMGPLMDGEAPVTGVSLSSDGSVAVLNVSFDDQLINVPEESTAAVVTIAQEATDEGITVLPSEQLTQEMPAPFGPGEGIGLLIAAIVLFITLGSLVVAGLPLATAIVGVLVGVGAAYALSSVIPMTSMTPVLALMIGLAVGIDYALFIVNRTRRLILEKGLSAHEATGRAVGTAGSAVFFAGLTVLVSLSALSIVGIKFLTVMALIAAGTVAIAVLVALTLLPALLGFVGDRVVPDKQRAAYAARSAARGSDDPHGPATRWAQGVVKHRWLATGGVVVVLGALSLPVLAMNLNLPSAASANLDSVERQAYDATADAFGEGLNGPLLVVASSDQALTPDEIANARDALVEVDGVASVIPGGISQDGTLAIYTVIPTTGPTDAATADLVNELRSDATAQAAGTSIGVTGVTAINIDMSKVLSDALVPYLAIIVLVSLVILMLVFRSIFVPITATLGFVLTIGAALGATTAVFQWGHLHQLFAFDTPGPLLSFLPIIVTGILYGLAMDYQVFLVSSMRESHVHGHPGVKGVVHGFHGAARVVVAAAVIMVSVFGSFIFGDEAMIKQIGFTLAFGILIDAFVVRMTLIPAVMAIAGEKAWWLPRWLDRLLPNLDVEGDKLVRQLEAQVAAEEATEPGREPATV
ncbi:MMPL family transporter [Cellulomonas composti]|uniref:Membrane protein n=1 Tax=Cellulomonas composti TaxID=266130 RepID=A0A511JDQ3_9CELL|nr:MMPL family transporter [Cellulomonas composti]GEL95919.1 membrane protein [Cellulomonas composti]